MGKKGGGSTTTSTSSNSPPPEVMQQYQDIINRANPVSQQPLQQYQGQIVADFSPLQQQAFGNIGNLSNTLSPYLNQAQSLYQQAAQPINVTPTSQSSLAQYMNPYQQDVINSTRANLQENDAQQNQQLMGNAISKGAWGGDRAGIAQAELARQQSLADNQTIAGLNSQNYNQALSALQNQQSRELQQGVAQNQLSQGAASGLGNLGSLAYQGGLGDINAQLTGGQLQQQQAQQQLNVPYQQFQQAQAYPYQQLSWLSGISTGLGSDMGGTSTSTQTAPASNSALGLFGLKDGGAVPHYASGGPLAMLAGGLRQGGDSLPPWLQTGLQVAQMALPFFLRNGGAVPHYVSGGLVPDVSVSYVPAAQQIQTSNTLPNAQIAPSNSGGGGGLDSLASLAKMFGSSGASQISDPFAAANAPFNAGNLDSVKGLPSLGSVSSSASSSGGIGDALSSAGDWLASFFANGGAVPHYAEGGYIANPFAMQTPWNPVSAMSLPTDILAGGVGGDLGSGGAMQDTLSHPLVPQSPIPQTGIPQSGKPAAFPQAMQPMPQQSSTAPDLSSLMGNASTPTLSGGAANDALSSSAGAQPSMGQSLLAAGLGALAGNSPYIAQNIARGGLMGLQNYGQQKAALVEQAQKASEEKRQEAAQQATQKYQEGELQAHAQELAELAKYHRGELANQNRDEFQPVNMPDGSVTLVGRKSGTVKPLGYGVASADGSASDSAQKTFGFPISPMSKDALKQLRQADLAQQKNEQVTGQVADNVLNIVDSLEPHLTGEFKTGFGGNARALGSSAARYVGLGGKDTENAAITAGAIDKGTNDLVTELNKFQYVPGSRGSVLALKTLLASKPGLTQQPEVNESIINGIRSKVWNYKVEDELRSQYRDANPLKIADSNVDKLGDALKKQYPIESIDPKSGKVTFNAENVQKIREAIPDAISNPTKYLHAAKGGPGVAPSNASIPLAAIEHLRSDPSLAKDFEAKYGASASQYLGSAQ